MDAFDDIDHVIEIREVNAVRDRQPRVFRNRIDPFKIFNDREFRQRYRLNKECARYVTSLVEVRLNPLSFFICYHFYIIIAYFILTLRFACNLQ